MAYAQNGLIEAVDFNTFRSQLLSFYGEGTGNAGYGQTSAVAAVADGLVETIKSVEWTALQAEMFNAAEHQGGSTALIPLATDLEVGDAITAHDGATDAHDIPSVLTTLYANRLDVAATATALYTDRSVQTVSNSWVGVATTTIDLTWATEDDARYFFNTGGEIIISVTRTGGTSATQNTSWTTLLDDIGTVVINHNSVVKNGTQGADTALGYYNMTNSATQETLFSATPADVSGIAYYGVNTFEVLGRTIGATTNGANGNVVRLTIQMVDNFAGTTDAVDGDLTFTINERRASTYLTAPTFTASIVTPLSAV